MKKIIFALSLITVFTGMVKAQNGPVMTFEKTEIDYGNVPQGGDGLRLFKFKNTGTSPLIIKNATGSCGCTVPKWPVEPIQPGQVATIEVKYATERLGGFTKTVTVETNATVNKQVLTIKGNVYEKKFENAAANSSSNKR
jgi:Protein of unknown function (DUF1573)